MVPTGARRPSETRGTDTDLVITAEVADTSTDEETGAEAEGPAEAG